MGTGSKRQKRRKPYQILVIEDDSNTHDIVSRVLMKRGYHVTVATQVESAIGMLSQVPFKVVLTDIFMSGIEGIILIRERLPDVKIFAMSAGYSEMSSSPTLRAAEKIGADAILAKPFDLEELAKTVHALIADTTEVAEVGPTASE